ncbi:MAG: tripartite tricarboxylate transporter substrate binding protein BugD [Enhydrobacter sp.]|nr:tripartite tricarboxylate transporter substrate binding protein BugD [Enhydrobacter sp.]
MPWIERLVPFALLLAALMPVPAATQEAYPSRPINLVTPYAAGGGSDVVTRVLADELRRQLGQPVTVQNITGAGGNIGTQRVAQAAPDGYTLLLHHVGMATAPALYKAPGFDPVKSFEPIGMFADIPMLLLASRDVPASNMNELLAWVRKQGDTVTFASSGQGSATHLCAIMFQQLAGANVTMVQYRGAAPAIADLQAGRVHLLCDGPQSASQLVRAGALKAYVLIGGQRLESLPEVPTTRELGLQAMDVSLWYGLYAPAGTPRAIVDRLAVALQGATASAELRAKLNGMEILVFDSAQATPTALRERLESQVALWGRVIREARIPVN